MSGAFAILVFFCLLIAAAISSCSARHAPLHAAPLLAGVLGRRRRDGAAAGKPFPGPERAKRPPKEKPAPPTVDVAWCTRCGAAYLVDADARDRAVCFECPGAPTDGMRVARYVLATSPEGAPRS